MLFGIAFVADFTVENRTGHSICVTPVGTIGLEGRSVGKEGVKAPLPTVLFTLLPLPAGKAGGFRLAPGESVTILYDMDDINFSEIVVEDGQSRQYQLVVNPNPATNQYHAPRQRHFVIDDLTRLAQVAPDVSVAARRAQGYQSRALIMDALLIGPWLAYAGIRFGLARVQVKPDGQAQNPDPQPREG
ncbi:MAG TPA: hypothetical protein PK184_13175 [Phycisphaerae bacterium]|nr:hypothetical protein [Phycisphaerae bacterium]HQA44169.1 hypothetical protein [Phycisphaerae bacterium]